MRSVGERSIAVEFFTNREGVTLRGTGPDKKITFSFQYKSNITTDNTACYCSIEEPDRGLFLSGRGLKLSRTGVQNSKHTSGAEQEKHLQNRLKLNKLMMRSKAEFTFR